MVEAERCPQCGEELAADAPEGLCPECLLVQGISASALLSSPKLGPFIPPEPAELADSFPQLEILQLLGQGGMGAVYKARQRKLDRLVALKILPLQAGSDPSFAERFAREARALARLNHPNVVGVHDFGEVGGLYYFVMEYVDGVNLRQLLETGQLTPDEALKIVPQICEALQYAHEEEIVHRDIKPENILLTKRGRVKIADFGLAKLLGAPPSGFSLTGSQQIMGTPFYMAPEQMQKARTVDHRADIYSLGVVFYEMLTGELPLGRFAPPSQKVGVDQRLDEVVFRALEKEPEHRYQHISEVKSAVERIAANESAASRPAKSEAPAARAGQHTGSQPRLRVWLANGSEGLLRLVGEALFLEYKAGMIASWFSNRYKELRIPLEDLESVNLEKHWRQVQLKLRASRLSTLADVPYCFHGEAVFTVKREDRQTAERFVALVARRLPGVVSEMVPLAEQEQVEMETVQRRLRGPALGLLVSGIITCIFWYIVLIVHISGGFGTFHFLDSIAVVLEMLAATGGVLLVVGAAKMKIYDNFPLAVATSIFGLIPLSPAWFLSCPMGIWALVELFRANTLAAFALRRQGWQPAGGAKGFSGPGDVLRRVPLQALGLILTGILAFLFWGFVTLFNVADLTKVYQSDTLGMICLGTMCLVAAIVVLIGGFCLKKREAYPLAVAASVLAMVPWSPIAILGLPLGFWALLTLCRPEVRAAFGHSVPAAEPAAPESPAKAPLPTGAIQRKVRSFLGSVRSLFLTSRVKGPIPTQDYQPRGSDELPR
jgi:serine/threonine protein kinase